MTVGFPLVALVVIVAVILVVRLDRAKRSVILKRAGFIVMAIPAAMFGLFALGETSTDPGGWEAVALTLSWALPLAALAAIAWLRPNWAPWVFAILVAGLIGVAIWFAADTEGWRAFEDRNGPVRDIGAFTVAFAIALLGLKRPRPAGILLLVLGIVPLSIFVASHEGFRGIELLWVLTYPPVVTGVLYLLSAYAESGSPGRAPIEPHGQPSPG
jgi:hypothetical protein